jgi:hypothetical protein
MGAQLADNPMAGPHSVQQERSGRVLSKQIPFRLVNKVRLSSKLKVPTTTSSLWKSSKTSVGKIGVSDFWVDVLAFAIQKTIPLASWTNPGSWTKSRHSHFVSQIPLRQPMGY